MAEVVSNTSYGRPYWFAFRHFDCFGSSATESAICAANPLNPGMNEDADGDGFTAAVPYRRIYSVT